ncbi:MAG: hypothetical protein IKA93_04365 [Elusimicrobiaceae bacterium]|nr:hypothetical protein [Elusimicrobiaceae bacterium]
MPDFKLTFQEEVRRLARKEVKAANEILAAQQKTIRELTKRIEALEKKQAVATPVAPKDDKPAVLVVPAKSGKARFSPKTLLAFRKKYALSQKVLGALLGVTVGTVLNWETGKCRPKANQVEAISALAKLGKRKVEALLAEKAPEVFTAIKAKKDKMAAKNPAKAAKKPAKATKPARKAKAPKATKTVAVPAPAVATDKVITVKP